MHVLITWNLAKQHPLSETKARWLDIKIFYRDLKKSTEIPQRVVDQVCVRGIIETHYQAHIWHVTIYTQLFCGRGPRHCVTCLKQPSGNGDTFQITPRVQGKSFLHL